MTDHKNALIPYSGGIESMCLTAYARDNNMSVNLLVLADNKTEYPNRRSAMTTGIIQMGLTTMTRTVAMADNDYLQRQNGYIPGYKLSMVITSMAYAERLDIPLVLFGHCKENQYQSYTDQTEDFFKDTAKLYNKYYGRDPSGARSEVHVQNPFHWLNKAEVIRRYHMKVPLELSVSCDSLVLTGTDHCGKCQGCHDRAIAFDLAGVDDPTHYRQPPITD